MNTYNYEIKSLIFTNSDESSPQKVTNVFALMTATSPTGDTRSMNCNFFISTLPPTDAFVPFDDLTEDVVKGWIDQCDEQLQDYKRELDTKFSFDSHHNEVFNANPPWLNLSSPTVTSSGIEPTDLIKPTIVVPPTAQ